LSGANEQAKAAIARQDYTDAIRLLRPAAEAGSAEAQYLLGSLHFTSAEINADECHRWLRAAAAQHYPEAVYQLSRWQDASVFEPPTGDYYRTMLLRAAELGCIGAWRTLGRLYATGDEGFSKDLVFAREWYSRAAERGDVYAGYEYGVMLYMGEGGPSDRKTGLDWIRRAAREGELGAQHFLSEFRG
jgi:uncharacterized protein